MHREGEFSETDTKVAKGTLTMRASEPVTGPQNQAPEVGGKRLVLVQNWKHLLSSGGDEKGAGGPCRRLSRTLRDKQKMCQAGWASFQIANSLIACVWKPQSFPL